MMKRGGKNKHKQKKYRGEYPNRIHPDIHLSNITRLFLNHLFTVYNINT